MWRCRKEVVSVCRYRHHSNLANVGDLSRVICKATCNQNGSRSRRRSLNLQSSTFVPFGSDQLDWLSPPDVLLFQKRCELLWRWQQLRFLLAYKSNLRKLHHLGSWLLGAIRQLELTAKTRFDIEVNYAQVSVFTCSLSLVRGTF